ncbi:MAG: glycosyltransferase family 4 protein [Pseudomonadota bacterium]
MKLLYLAGSVLGSDSANSVHVMQMCAALGQAGHAVTLLAREGTLATTALYDHYGVEPAFAIERVPFTRRWHLLAYLRRARSLGCFDLLLGRYLYGLLALRECAPRFCYEVHDAPSAPRALLEQRLLRDPRCAALVTITGALAEHYRSRFAVLPEPLILPDAAQAAATIKAPRRSGRLVAGYAGAFYRGRGLPLLLALARTLPAVEFRLAGGSAADLARELPADSMLPPNLHCVGRLAPATVAEFLGECDLLLAPYEDRVAVAGNRGDTAAWCSPLKIFEYMAQGKAVLASALPGLSEVLEHERNALLLPPQQLQPWVDAVTRLDADRDEAVRLGAAALAQFQAQHSWRQRAQRLLDHVG